METFKVLYDFSAEEEGELSVSSNEVVVRHYDPQLEGAETPEGWMLVKSLQTGDVGFVPATYVTKVNPEAPKWSPSPLPGEKSRIDIEREEEEEEEEEDETVAHNNSSNITSDHNNMSVSFQVGYQGGKLEPGELFGGPDATPQRKHGAETNSVSSTAEYLRRSTLSLIKAKPSTQQILVDSKAVTGTGTMYDTSMRNDPLHSDMKMSYSNTIIPRPPMMNHQASMNATHQASMNATSTSHSAATALPAPTATPHFVTHAERDDIEELGNEVSHFLEKQIVNQQETSKSSKKHIDDISASLKNTLIGSESLISNLMRLNEVLEGEKKKIKQSGDNERHSYVLSKSKMVSERVT